MKLRKNLNKPITEISPCGNWGVYGSRYPKLVIAGHSHTYAMLYAVQNRQKLNSSVAVITQTDFSMNRIRDEEYWDFVAELSTFKTTAISWNGNQHNLHFLLDLEDPFTSYGLKSQSKEVLPFVPVSQIKALLRPTFYELELVLERFKDPSNLILIGTPAPKPKHVIKKFLLEDSYYQDLANSLNIKLSDIEVSSNELRVFMWDITQSLTEQVAIKFGCKFFPVPEITLAEDRTLAKAYWADDVTHASEDFGALMIEELLLLEKQLDAK